MFNNLYHQELSKRTNGLVSNGASPSRLTKSNGARVDSPAISSASLAAEDRPGSEGPLSPVADAAVEVYEGHNALSGSEDRWEIGRPPEPEPEPSDDVLVTADAPTPRVWEPEPLVSNEPIQGLEFGLAKKSKKKGKKVKKRVEEDSGIQVEEMEAPRLVVTVPEAVTPSPFSWG